ncbi:MAG: hypothetical protein WA705_11050 [Candidatus Ozemobacteraceae bacterium]
MRKTLHQRLILAFVLGLFFFCGAGFLPVSAAESSLKSDSSGLSQKLDGLYEKIGNVLQKQGAKFFGYLKDGKYLKLDISLSFYDKRIHKFLLSFKGTGLYSAELPLTPSAKEYFLTSDDILSYDVYIRNLTKGGAGYTFDVEGTLVLAVDKWVTEGTRKTASAITSGILLAAGEELLKFVECLNFQALAEATTETISNYSASNLSKRGESTIGEAGKQNNLPLVNLLKAAVKDKKMQAFFFMSLIPKSGMVMAGLAGGSLGAVAGNLLAPGVGGLIGAYVGAKTGGIIASTIIFEFTSAFPLSRLLKKIVENQKLLTATKSAGVAQTQFNEAVNGVLSKVKEDFDGNQYKVFDRLLEDIKGFPADQRNAFVPLLKKVQELLRFNIMEKGDWYAAKKYYQLKAEVDAWKLSSNFNFETNLKPKEK